MDKTQMFFIVSMAIGLLALGYGFAVFLIKEYILKRGQKDG